MIQELLGGVVEERKISIPSFATPNSSISSPSQSAASSPSPSSSAADAHHQQQQNLRCPRCDSSNTKFCYYNNYNLTQPRHFCKTCRRYWTKGGALRNVPIGGGCRKTKAVAPSIVASNGKTGGSSCKTKPMTSLDVMGRVVGLGGGGGLDHHHGGGPELLPSSPFMWASMPHSSHLLALLRASQMQPNHNPNPTHNHSTPSPLNSFRIKDEGLVFGGAQVMADPDCGLNAHSWGLDHLGQLPIGSCSSSLWKNENQFHYQQQLPQQQNLLLSEGPTSSGIQELYQRLSRSSSTSNNYCNSDNLQAIANNVTGCYSSAAATTTMATTTTASILEPIPQAGGDFGFWNPAMSWPDLSTTNGAFP